MASEEQAQLFRRAIDDLGLVLDPHAEFVVASSPSLVTALLDDVTRENALLTEQHLPNITLDDLRPATPASPTGG